MPPIMGLSDDESSGSEIPYKDPATKTTKDSSESSDESDSGEEEDEYVVEAIREHAFKNGILTFNVKWKGYEESDNTWEPEEHLNDAPDVLNAYFDKIGGRPEKQARKRKSTASIKEDTKSSTPAAKRARSTRDSTEENGTGPRDAKGNSLWTPRGKNWDDLVETVETIERDQEGNLWVFVTWNNEHKSKVSIAQAYEKCPRKMLHFYEQHLVFKTSED